MAETVARASCASLAHVGSMAASTTDDHLTVDDDAERCLRKHEGALLARDLCANGEGLWLATRTPSMLGLLAECWQSLRSAPQSSPCNETGRAIEADVYSVSPGQAAAHGGRAEHCGGRAAFSTLSSHIGI